MQLDKKLTYMSTVRKIIKEDGMKNLWRSFRVTLIMNVPFSMAMVSVNENLKVLTKP